MRNANRRRYHYIYKTTCTITNKYYLGMHSTDNLLDGYMGSGKRLGYSIRKHGRENHVCEILEHYFTREWLREREAELVNADQLIDPRCMNLKLGGEGGWDHIRTSFEHIEWVKQGRQKTDAILKQKGISKTDLGKMAHTACLKNKKGVAYDLDLKYKHNFKYNKTFQQSGNSVESRKKAAIKISASHATNSWQVGENNSQYGKCWIYSLTEQKSIKISKDQLSEYIGLGWMLGRKMKF